jgi:nitrogen-specific signal transduction histidine kinase/CheY-like chemotaxis protein
MPTARPGDPTSSADAERSVMADRIEALEARLQRSQKMEALGQLASGVAHDFNNLLMIVSGYCERLRAQPDTTDSQRAALEQMAIAASRAASLTAQLLAFSRQAVAEPTIVDLNRAVADTAELLRRTMGERIRFAMALDPRALPVRLSQDYVAQILVNLAVNARDAMPQGGEFAIATSRIDLDDDLAADRGVAPGAFVQLHVRDTGLGMSPDVKARAFELFYTTKPVGQGTGLGLATVYGIVKQSGGHIELDTAPGRGAEFTILLPAAETLSPVEPDAAPVAAPPTGTETILVVEDEDPVREIVVTMLHDLGYRTFDTGLAREALEIGERERGHIDLVVTDVVLPDLSGRELAEAIWRLDEGVRVLFMSGYTDDTVLTHGVEHADVAFLQKPFTRLALARKIRAVLDAP